MVCPRHGLDDIGLKKGVIGVTQEGLEHIGH